MILGHQRQIEYFDKAIMRERLAHAYLFYGPEHAGKFTLAKTLAKFFYCEARPDSLNETCGECLACLKVERNQHPHTIILDSENTLVSKKEKRKDIPIEDIRELKRRLSFASEGRQPRVVIINEAEKLSGDAADAFLKILEEPGENIVMVLVTSAPDLLPPTIVSRTQPVRFSTVSEEEMREFIVEKEKDSKNRELILAISSGRPGVALGLTAEKSRLHEELKFLKEVDTIFNRRLIPEALAFSERVSSDEEIRNKTIECVLRILRKNMLDSTKGGNMVTFMVQLKRVLDIADVLGTTNVNSRLAMDNVFLEAINPSV